ncbi:MAG: DUF2961 domain-containing protein [Kiritimatiellae bacterium]|nr:DUF2961 domain-containing protein [Kiritimatiellia bacterium]MDD5521313.1 DUF2961 domain-containing protein [Kiritimatiellia bacterium]
MNTSFDRTGGNQDGDYCEGITPDGKRLIADLKGPGCVRRIWWTGMPFENKFYFYFDNEKKPRFIKTYKELRGEGKPPFIPPLCNYPSGAGYCYLPVPFAKRLVVMADNVKQGTSCFYHINYESLPVTTMVCSLSEQLLNKVSANIEVVRSVLNANQCEAITREFNGQESMGTIAANTKKLMVKYEGPAVITEFRLVPVIPASLKITERNGLLRKLAIKIYWDDNDFPSVDVPLGDFFCNGVRSRSFRSMPVAVESGIFVMRFPMPFKKLARIELENGNNSPIDVCLGTKIRPINEWSNNMNYFHATWRQSMGAGVPYEILSFTGSGHYVGCYLVAIAMEGSWNILEGDESIYRENEIFPSLHGTGLEDYFNGGWYFNGGIYTMPFSGALERAGIRSTQFRFHVPDPIKFHNKIRVNIEFGHANISHGYMSSVAYWYSKVPVACPFKLPPASERLIPDDPLERSSILCEVFERERVRRLQEAIDICREYVEKYPTTAESALMELRAFAYKERLEGYDTVKNEYSRLYAESKDETVRRQAGILKWFHESSSNAIIVAHINGTYKIHLDGKLIKEGDCPIEADAIPVNVGNGSHWICAEVKKIRPDAWFSMYIRCHSTNFVSDTSWILTSEVPNGWLAGNSTGAKLIPVEAGGPFPWMRWFQFRPNAFVMTQYDKQLLYPRDGWQPGQTLYFCKEFKVDVNK